MRPKGSAAFRHSMRNFIASIPESVETIQFGLVDRHKEEASDGVLNRYGRATAFVLGDYLSRVCQDFSMLRNLGAGL